MQKPPSSVIANQKKRQQAGPFIIAAFGVVLLLAGVIVLGVWLTGEDSPTKAMFATETPTVTLTYTPTSSNTPSLTPTVTETPTITTTPTPSAPFVYTVEDGDYLMTIVEKFNLGPDGLSLILMLNPPVANPKTPAEKGIDPNTMSIDVGQRITIPNPGMPLPTDTPVPLTSLPNGYKIEYTIQPGDSLEAIASKFLSTVEDIMKENKITDENKIEAFQVITVRIKLVTPTNTLAPTATLGDTETPTPIPFLSTETPTPELVSTATPTP